MRPAREKDYEEWTAKMNDLREAQAATGEKLKKRKQKGQELHLPFP